MHVKRHRHGRQQASPYVPSISDSALTESSSKQASQRIDPLLTDFDLERLTGRARSTWQKARLTGDGPKFIRLGRLVRYPKREFDAWLAAFPRLRSTSEDA
jgi:predicted DNA-binding transcriptional regulator AlpA